MLRHPEVRTASQFGQCTANYVASCDYTIASNAAKCNLSQWGNDQYWRYRIQWLYTQIWTVAVNNALPLEAAAAKALLHIFDFVFTAYHCRLVCWISLYSTSWHTRMKTRLPPRSRSQSWVDPCGPNLGKCGVLQICFRFWINHYTRKRQRYKHHGDRNLIKIAGFWPGAKFRGWIGQMSEWILQLHPAWCVIYFWRRWPSLDIESLEVTKEKWKRKKRRQ